MTMMTSRRVRPLFHVLSRSASTLLIALLIGLLCAAAASLSGCAHVHQKEREFLSDPIMQFVPDPLGGRMETHNFPRREGSAGGGSGSGGGCGC